MNFVKETIKFGVKTCIATAVFVGAVDIGMDLGCKIGSAVTGLVKDHKIVKVNNEEA